MNYLWFLGGISVQHLAGIAKQKLHSDYFRKEKIV
jgi:hypothetical protein